MIYLTAGGRGKDACVSSFESLQAAPMNTINIIGSNIQESEHDVFVRFMQLRGWGGCPTRAS